MRHIRISCVVLVTAFALFSAGCPQTGGTGGGGIGGPNEPGEPVPGFFAADESWAVGSSTFFVLGIGNFVELMVVHSEEAGADPCVIADPGAEVTFEGGRLSIQTNSERTPTDQTCRINASFDAALCAPGESGQIATTCDLRAFEGSVELDGQSVGAGEPVVVRFEDCNDDIPALAQIDEWNLLSVHPFFLSLTSDPRFLGGALIGNGRGASLGDFLLATSTSGGDSVALCRDVTPSGTVTLVAGVLNIDLTVESEDGGACEARFTGTISSCTLFDPALLGGSGEVVQLIRFDGPGRIETGEASVSLPTLYFGFVASR